MRHGVHAKVEFTGDGKLACMVCGATMPTGSELSAWVQVHRRRLGDALYRLVTGVTLEV